jgi:hypothetical protein
MTGEKETTFVLINIQQSSMVLVIIVKDPLKKSGKKAIKSYNNDHKWNIILIFCPVVQ